MGFKGPEYFPAEFILHIQQSLHTGMAKVSHLIFTYTLDKVMCQMSACSMSVF